MYWGGSFKKIIMINVRIYRMIVWFAFFILFGVQYFTDKKETNLQFWAVIILFLIWKEIIQSQKQ